LRVNDLFYWNAYYNAGFKARAEGYAAYIGESASGDLTFANTASSAASAGSSISFVTRYNIDKDGVATWQNVGGVAGTALTLNANGLGLGVTPSAWGSYYKVIESAGAAAFVVGSANVNGVNIASNCFNNNTNWIYKETGAAARFSTNTNVFQWFTAPSGTAGNPITFTQAMTLDASGKLLVGTVTAPNPGAASTVSGFSINGSGNDAYISLKIDNGTCGYFRRDSDGHVLNFYKGNSGVGNISVTASACTFNSTSDYRLKESVQPLVGGLARVNALKPSTYKWKADGSAGEGFLAHELAEVIPAAVTGQKDAVNADGTINAQGVDLSRVVPVLVAAIQELTARVQTLETR